MRSATGFTDQLNSFRAAHNLPPLAPHPLVTKVAQSHAEDLAARQVLSHGSGFENRDTAANRLAAAGYPWRFAAENVAFGQQNETQLFDAWANSPDHLATYLTDQACHMGLGQSQNPLGPYWVLVVAAPL